MSLKDLLVLHSIDFGKKTMGFIDIRAQSFKPNNIHVRSTHKYNPSDMV